MTVTVRKAVTLMLQKQNNVIDKSAPEDYHNSMDVLRRIAECSRPLYRGLFLQSAGAAVCKITKTIAKENTVCDAQISHNAE